jgi:hypothetical protein
MAGDETEAIEQKKNEYDAYTGLPFMTPGPT